MTPITEQLYKNLPMNYIIADDLCDGIQARYEPNYLDDTDNLESLIVGRKKFMFLEQPMFECNIEYW